MIGSRYILLISAATLALAMAAPSLALGEFNTSTGGDVTVISTADGTGKTAHQVIDAAGASLTCAGISVHGVIKGGHTTALTLNPTYTGTCTFVGQTATVEMRGCHYTLTSHGTFSVTSKSGQNCATEPMRFSVPSPACTITIGPQEGKHEATYKNIMPGSVNELTVELHVTGTKYTATGAGCPETGVKENGNYTTGNFILTAEQVGGGTMFGLSW